MIRAFARAAGALVFCALVLEHQPTQGQTQGVVVPFDPKPLKIEMPPLSRFPLPATGAPTPALPAVTSTKPGEIDTTIPLADAQCKLRNDSVQDADGKARIVLGCDN